MELIFPCEPIISIYLWDSSHGKLAGAWEKHSCIIQVARKMHTSLGRTESKASHALGLVCVLKPHGGHPSPGVLRVEDRPPRLLGDLRGQEERLKLSPHS